MNRAGALGLAALMALLTAAALAAPSPVAAAILALAVPAMRTGRGAFLGLLALALPVNIAVLALVSARGPLEGALEGLVGGTRLAAALGANLAILSFAGAAGILEGLRLPPRATALAAAVLLAAQDVARDFDRLRTARRLEGGWPDGRFARARVAATLLPALVLGSHRRATSRRDALRLAGHAMPHWFVPVVAVAALCAAGRMAFLWVPNVALTYVVAFLGGLLFGPLVGAAGAFYGMALTDFLLTGLYPLGFVNAPAMALLGLAGGWLRRMDLVGGTPDERAAARLLAASIGLLATFAFSVAADVLTWALVYRGEVAALGPLVLMGLAFNVVPALVNAVIFGAAVSPTLRAWRAAQQAPRPRRAPGAAPEPETPEAPPAA